MYERHAQDDRRQSPRRLGHLAGMKTPLMQAVGFVPGREKIPRIQEKYVKAGTSENAIQPVIGCGGGGCCDKIFLQIIFSLE
jgi:hypothetical protein